MSGHAQVLEHSSRALPQPCALSLWWAEQHPQAAHAWAWALGNRLAAVVKDLQEGCPGGPGGIAGPDGKEAVDAGDRGELRTHLGSPRREGREAAGTPRSWPGQEPRPLEPPKEPARPLWILLLRPLWTSDLQNRKLIHLCPFSCQVHGWSLAARAEETVGLCSG